MVLYFKNGSQIEILSCHNPNVNTTQPQHCSWVGHENDFASMSGKRPHVLSQVVEIEICTRLWFVNCQDRDSAKIAIFKETKITQDSTKIVKIKIIA